MLLKKWEQLPPEMQTDEVRKYYDILKKKQGSLFFKRVFDIIASLVLLVILSPVFLILAVAIKLDSKGPVFYRQERVTQYGKHFYHRDIEKNTFAASHDSFHETSQHIFGLLLDGSIPANTLYAENTAVIDLIPAITEEKFGLVLNPERRELRQDLRRLFAEKKVPGF